MTDRLDAIRKGHPWHCCPMCGGVKTNDTSRGGTAKCYHCALCSFIECGDTPHDRYEAENASLRARVETAEQEIAAAVAVFHGDPPIPNEMTLVEKVQNVCAQLSEARTKQAEAEARIKQHEAMYWPHAKDSREAHLYEIRNGRNLEFVEAHVAELIDEALTEERTRREQAEQKAREATASAAVEMKARLHTEAERDTLQRDLDALRQHCSTN